MQLQDLTTELTDAFGLVRGRGVLVSAVEPGSPAAEIAIERGLVIYRVGRHDVNSVRSIEDLLTRVESGMTVAFTVGIARSDGDAPNANGIVDSTLKFFRQRCARKVVSNNQSQ